MKHCPSLFALLSLCLAACTGKSNPPGEVAGANRAGTPPQAVAWTDSTACYRAVSGKDSVFLHVKVEGSKVTGDLVYAFHEKDRNTGTIRGAPRGDTLFAEYTFLSEGQQLVREVAFLKRGSQLAEGFGPAREASGRMVFVDRSALNFTSALVYNRVDCAPDERGCMVSVGYRWSALKKDCIQPATAGIRLNLLAETSRRTVPAFLLLSTDQKQGELFLPQSKTAVLLERQGEEGNHYWENGDWKVYPWKGYVLKYRNKAVYAGQ